MKKNRERIMPLVFSTGCRFAVFGVVLCSALDQESVPYDAISKNPLPDRFF
jgi:hypothetical protein